MGKELYLGFDTSNYTTSIAVCDGENNILANLKTLLPVKEGERGLRQSDAVFSHVKNIPTMTEELKKVVSEYTSIGYKVEAVAVSEKPRDAEGSYMPCFLVGLSAAESVSASLGVPLYKTTHQAGHIAAASLSACGTEKFSSLIEKEFLALHVSGGTTDLLHVRPDSDKIFDIERIGGSRDANAGQMIDRTGVRLGMKFPCGPALDKAALDYTGKRPSVGRLPVNGTECNLSGLENKAMSLIESGASVEEVSAFVLEYVARTLEKIVSAAKESVGDVPVVYAGGVMSSGYIKMRLLGSGLFSSPAFSSDNAAGVTVIGALLHKKKKV